MQKYSVFISYRRTGFDTANLIAEKLRSMGYSVFFDVESLRGGKFNEQLFQVIDNCTDFVLVLPKDALDRCSDKDDWVRKEVMYAMLKGKNIVPVMLNDFDWPNPMPNGMEDLKDYQAVTASDRNTFDLAMQRLASYLKSPHRNRVFLIRIAGIIAAVLVLLGILFCALRIASGPICRQTADVLSCNTELAHQIYFNADKMKTHWQEYVRAMIAAPTTQRRQELSEKLMSYLDHVQSDMNSIRSEIIVSDDYSALEKMLLISRGIFPMELAIAPSYVSSLCDDIDSICVHLTNSLDGMYYDSYIEQQITMEFALLTHTVNMYYYSYLSELSHFPSSAKEMHRQLSSAWNMFPTESDNQSARYYDDKAQKEMDKASKVIADFGNYVQQQDGEVGKIEQQLDELQVQIDSVATLQATDLDVNQQMYETQVERVQLKSELVKQKREQLEESKKQVEEIYQNLLLSCTIEEKDAESYQWGKICHLAEMLQTTVDNHRANSSGGVLSPDRILADLNKQIDIYVNFHPESQAYMPALKAFYRLVATDQVSLGGQLVFAFLKDKKNTMDNVHGLYRVGDIIVKRNNQPVTDYQSMADAASLTPFIPNSNAARGTVSYYRLEHNNLVLHFDSVPCDTTILVGYRNVGE